MNIRGNFEAEGAQFLSEKHSANFNSMKVGQSVLFGKITFKGPVDFVRSDIGGTFQADGAQFTGTANFAGLKVEQKALFRNATFKGPVDLRFSSFEALDLLDVDFTKTIFKLEGLDLQKY